MFSLILYGILIVIGLVIAGAVIMLALGVAGVILKIIGTIIKTVCQIIGIFIGTVWRYKINLCLLAGMMQFTESPVVSLLVYIVTVYIASKRDASKNITAQLKKLVAERPVSYQEVAQIRPENNSLSHAFRSLTCSKNTGLKIMQKWVRQGTIINKKLYDDKDYYYCEEKLGAFEKKVFDRTVKYLDDEFEKFGLYDLKNDAKFDVLYYPILSLENAYQKIVIDESLQNRVSNKAIEKIYIGQDYEECMYIETKRLYEIGESLMHQDIFDRKNLKRKLGKHSKLVYDECLNQWKAKGLDFSACDEKKASDSVYVTPQLKQKAIAAVDEPTLDLMNFISEHDKYTMQERVCAMNYLIHEIGDFNFEPATNSQSQYWINVKFKQQYQCDTCKKLFMNLISYNGSQYCEECLEELRKKERKKEQEVITEKKYIDAPPPGVIIKIH